MEILFFFEKRNFSVKITTECNFVRNYRNYYCKKEKYSSLILND